jgi:hypothetical protein
MSNLTDFFPSGGGGLTPKFQEFNASGTFTPTQSLIDAGGYIEIFLVAGGPSANSGGDNGASGGEVIMENMYLTSTNPITVTIAAGGVSGNNGGNSVFLGATAGGDDLTALGGISNAASDNRQISSSSWGARVVSNWGFSAGTGVFGYGAGSSNYYGGGIRIAKANSGQASFYGGSYNNGGSGYCLIKWYE